LGLLLAVPEGAVAELVGDVFYVSVSPKIE
jgi:hypothetical protein